MGLGLAREPDWVPWIGSGSFLVLAQDQDENIQTATPFKADHTDTDTRGTRRDKSSETFMWVRLDYLPLLLKRQNFMQVGHTISLERQAFIWVRLNHLPVSLAQRTSKWVKLNYLPLLLEQRTFLRVSSEPSYGSGLIIILHHCSSRPLSGLALIIFLCRWSSRLLYGVANLHVNKADFIYEMLELSLSASDFDKYLRMHSILFCMYASDAHGFTGLYVRLNHLPFSLEQWTFLRIKLNYLPVSLEQ
ncbi:hypothetical protein Cgig2_027711 [Carnegiea gigantea]|uniref:Uncharacterized protein n=1 Tax=Carnegiea gigantea TaxID=171969 RepID=A0A9Q1JWA0_9CARY|nr:hypothetical protein Cgig2_027711 [Carnegiea gigantea]